MCTHASSDRPVNCRCNRLLGAQNGQDSGLAMIVDRSVSGLSRDVCTANTVPNQYVSEQFHVIVRLIL